MHWYGLDTLTYVHVGSYNGEKHPETLGKLSALRFPKTVR
jgi:hypothetical protein